MRSLALKRIDIGPEKHATPARSSHRLNTPLAFELMHSRWRQIETRSDVGGVEQLHVPQIVRRKCGFHDGIAVV